MLGPLVIPKTETPGAKDVGVPMFIDSLLNEVYDKEGQRSFVKSLTDFNDDAKTYGHDFIKCSDDEKVELFRKYHDAAIKSNTEKGSAGSWNAAVKENKPFILQIKELTIFYE